MYLGIDSVQRIYPKRQRGHKPQVERIGNFFILDLYQYGDGQMVGVGIRPCLDLFQAAYECIAGSFVINFLYVQHFQTRLVQLGNTGRRIFPKQCSSDMVGIESALRVVEYVEFDLANTLRLKLLLKWNV